MSKSSKILLVTDYFGILHKTPVGNKDYYEAQNARNKNLQFTFKEVSEDEADKFIEDNQGADPNFIKPGDAPKLLSEKDDRIKALEEELAKLKAGGSTASTEKVPAKELIEKINAATTPEEVEGLVTKDEERTTVIDAAKAKKKELKDAAKQ